MRINYKKLLVFFCVVLLNISYAQKKADPWKELVEEKNCIVSFIFYSKANNINNGLVIKIENKNNFDIIFEFTIIAKSINKTREKTFKGIILGGKIITGSNNDYFWIPELSRESIAEVGIKKCKFLRVKK